MLSGNSLGSTLLDGLASDANAVADLLTWDSEFWGVPIAQVRGDVLDATRLEAVNEFCREHGIACLYFLATADDPGATRIAEEAGFHLTDVRITLRREDTDFARDARPQVDNRVTIRRWQDPDIPELRRIASESHRNTRFFADTRFSRERCVRFYETWIERSCTGYADAVLVAEADAHPIGYITCHLPTAKGVSGRIGLIGIDKRVRGRGIGSRLVAAAMAWFATAGVEKVTVVTQGRNLAAIRLYERTGFQTDLVQLWYHKWYLPREGFD